MSTELNAEVASVTYFNAENGYLVARVRAKGEPGLVTIVGNVGQVAPGEMLELLGGWKDHPRFGRQFEAESCRKVLPASENGVRRYLASGMIRGIGPVLAGRLVETFGADVLDILDKTPEKLMRVEGVGRKTLRGIIESWEEQREIRDLMVFLQTHEVSPTHAPKIFARYGVGSVAKLKENPYDLAYDLRGVGFRTADRMALKLGFAPDSPKRLEAAVVYGLFTLSEQGHLFFPLDRLINHTLRLLDLDDAEKVDEDDVMRAVASLEELKRIAVEALPEQGIENAVYLRHMHKFETEAAARVYNLAVHPHPLSEDKIARSLADIERKEGLELSSEQREAVLGGCMNKVFIITGGPGTGKTTITRFLVRVLDDLGLTVRTAAPTGRAAKRLSEATGTQAVTLHRLLQYTPGTGFQLGEDNKLKAGVVVVDEASMLDMQLFLGLLKSLPMTCRLVLIGDVDQLPSVGAGDVLRDMIEADTVPKAVLTHIFRQARESMIVVNAHRVNEGEPPISRNRPAPQEDFFWIERQAPEDVRDTILTMVCERIPARYGLDPIRDVQVLAPMHKGEVGTQRLNELLQTRLNPMGVSVGQGKRILRRGDKVLQLRNNYDKEVFNGDMGFVTNVDGNAGTLMVDFEGRELAYDATDMDELAPAYAVSVHKSQGSEYPAVVVPVVTQHYMLLQRNLIYTALTRAKKLAVLVGSTRAMKIGLDNASAGARYTHLKWRLKQWFEGNVAY